MAATTTYKVEITLAFADATSRKLTFNGVDEDKLIFVKPRIKLLNSSFPENVARTFISAIGARSTMISKAVIIGVEEERIYSAS